MHVKKLVLDYYVNNFIHVNFLYHSLNCVYDVQDITYTTGSSIRELS